MIEFTEQGKRKQRHIFLFNDILVCTQQQKARFTDKVTYEYRWMVTVADSSIGHVERRWTAERLSGDEGKAYCERETLMLITLTIELHAIGIKGDGGKFLLATNSEEELKRWLEAVETARTKFQERIQTIEQQHLQKRIAALSESKYRLSLLPVELSQTVDLRDFIGFEQALRVCRDRIEQLRYEYKSEQKVRNMNHGVKHLIYRRRSSSDSIAQMKRISLPPVASHELIWMHSVKKAIES